MKLAEFVNRQTLAQKHVNQIQQYRVCPWISLLYVEVKSQNV